MHLKSWAISRSTEQLHRFTTSISPSRYLNRIYFDLLLAILMSSVYIYVFIFIVLGYSLDFVEINSISSIFESDLLPQLNDNTDNDIYTILNSSWIFVISIFNITSLPLKLFIAWKLRMIISSQHNLLYLGIILAIINALVSFLDGQCNRTALIINWLIGMLIIRIVFYFGAAENIKESQILNKKSKKIDLTTISLDEVTILHEDCPICMENLTYLELSVSRLVCGHIFHRICILKWIQRQQVCPLCKSMLAKKEPIQQ